MRGLQTAADARRRALEALAQQGQMGTQLRQSDYQLQRDRAAAQDRLDVDAYGYANGGVMSPVVKRQLQAFQRILRGIQDIAFVEFDRHDVVRHKLVQRMVDEIAERARQGEAAARNALDAYQDRLMTDAPANYDIDDGGDVSPQDLRDRAMRAEDAARKILELGPKVLLAKKGEYGAAIVMDGRKVAGVFTTVDACRALAELLKKTPRA